MNAASIAVQRVMADQKVALEAGEQEELARMQAS